MPSQLTQFHYHFSDVNSSFDFSDPKFTVDKVHQYYYLKHSRPLIQGFFDSKLLPKIEEIAKTGRDYEELYGKMKEFSHAASLKYSTTQ